MMYQNPWATVFQKVLTNGDSNKLSTHALDVLNRLSDKANPYTGLVFIDLTWLSRETGRSIGNIHNEVAELMYARVIMRLTNMEKGLYMVHPRLRSSSSDNAMLEQA